METTATLADALAAMREKVGSMVKPQIKAVMEGHIEALRAAERAWEMPMPARYIVDRNGEIVDAHIDPDYRYRPEPVQTVERLTSL